MTTTNTGRFVWYELMTTDPSAAIAFYTHVIGWTTHTWGERSEPYTMWVGSQGPLGGTMKLPEEAHKAGAPPHWMANVEVADVDATAAKARGLGARVHVEPMDIPKLGRIAVIADPQGAALAMFKSNEAKPDEAKPDEAMPLHTAKAGEFGWSELLTTDHEAAFRFYSELFGWQKVNELDMGPMGKYLLFGHGERPFGGMLTKLKDMSMPPAWLYYVEVDDLDAAIERAKAKGGRVANGPMEDPGGDRIAQLFDPQGAAFGLFERTVKA